MNKIEIYSYLKEQNIEYEAAEHKAVFNMKELETIELPHPDNTDCVLCPTWPRWPTTSKPSII